MEPLWNKICRIFGIAAKKTKVMTEEANKTQETQNPEDLIPVEGSQEYQISPDSLQKAMDELKFEKEFEKSAGNSIAIRYEIGGVQYIKKISREDINKAYAEALKGNEP